MNKALKHISIWFGVIMILMVTAGAVAFAFTDLMNDRLYGTKRTVFVFILLAYGIYRGFRLYQTIRYLKDENE